MEAGDGRRTSVSQYLLTGLETGVLAALAMLVWLGVSAMWYRKSFWTPPNLLAAAFYGESALRNRFTVHTFAGLALYLVIYGALGMLFGLAIQDRHPSLRITCIGVLSAIGWYYLVFGWIWKRWDPLLVLYTHERSMFVGHVLYGVILGRYPRTRPGPRVEREEVVQGMTLAPPVGPSPPGGDVDVEVKS
jgi:hypothetical protein